MGWSRGWGLGPGGTAKTPDSLALVVIVKCHPTIHHTTPWCPGLNPVTRRCIWPWQFHLRPKSSHFFVRYFYGGLFLGRLNYCFPSISVVIFIVPYICLFVSPAFLHVFREKCNHPLWGEIQLGVKGLLTQFSCVRLDKPQSGTLWWVIEVEYHRIQGGRN